MKIRPPLASPFLRSLSERGFTLIELLVVISIIAVLAGLLFPAMGAVRTSARKASAANDCMQIVNAVKNFYTDYGKYPITATSSGDDDEKTVKFGGKGSSNSAIIDELRAVKFDHNTRKVRYLEVKELPGATDNPPRGAVIKSGTAAAASSSWYDPWKEPYLVFVDGSYSGQVEITDLGDSKDTVIKNSTLNVGVAAASLGPATSAKKFETPVGSWK
ncbi:MAG TPA: type II secretion system protein [Chthoniobacteraceae bacterium]|nr:type II secretion system protein [Chthoniobacteraceae bacterium]